jgi:hypothetical protein
MTMDERRAVEERVAPTGRDARLWRVLLELSRSVVEAAVDTSDRSDAPRAKPLAPGQLERLVVEFDDAYTTFVEGMERLPSESQLMALQAVDRQLAAMVRAQEAELWTQRALREDDRWRETQRLACGVLEAFDWPALRLVLVATAAVDEERKESSGAPGLPRRRS